jgi:hypothetical protein
MISKDMFILNASTKLPTIYNKLILPYAQTLTFQSLTQLNESVWIVLLPESHSQLDIRGQTETGLENAKERYKTRSMRKLA